LVSNKKTGTYAKITVAARGANGANLAAAATITVTFSHTGGAFAPKSVTTRTSASSGTVVLSSPSAFVSGTVITLNSASLTGYTWDKAVSFQPTTVY
jgi:hypothetical protein